MKSEKKREKARRETYIIPFTNTSYPTMKGVGWEKERKGGRRKARGEKKHTL